MRLPVTGRSERTLLGNGTLWTLLASMGTVSSVLAISLGLSLRRERALRRKAELLGHMAMTDPLTGLANRRYFHRRLRQSLALAVRRSLPLAVVLVDLDDFKRVNDRYGHMTGDRVLWAVARQLETDKRVEDLVVRYGGEEFALILEGTNLNGGLARAERLRASLHELFLPVGHGRAIRVTASFGVAAFPDTSGPRPEPLVAHADEALYRAKREGRDRCVAARPSKEAVSREESWMRLEHGKNGGSKAPEPEREDEHALGGAAAGDGELDPKGR